MNKNRLRIAVAVFTTLLFFVGAVAHACIGTVAPRGEHDHRGIQPAGLVQTPHGEAQDENCRSVRDRFVSLVSGPSQSHPYAGDLYAIPDIGEQLEAELRTLSAARPPGSSFIADDQPSLYIFNSVFRI